MIANKIKLQDIQTPEELAITTCSHQNLIETFNEVGVAAKAIWEDETVVVGDYSGGLKLLLEIFEEIYKLEDKDVAATVVSFLWFFELNQYNFWADITVINKHQSPDAEDEEMMKSDQSTELEGILSGIFIYSSKENRRQADQLEQDKAAALYKQRQTAALDYYEDIITALEKAGFSNPATLVTYTEDYTEAGDSFYVETLLANDLTHKVRFSAHYPADENIIYESKDKFDEPSDEIFDKITALDKKLIAQYNQS